MQAQKKKTWTSAVSASHASQMVLQDPLIQTTYVSTQQFEFSITKNSNFSRPVAKSVAVDGYPPMLFCARGSRIKSRSPENFYIGEAQGIGSSLRAHLPDFNFWSSQIRKLLEKRDIMIEVWFKSTDESGMDEVFVGPSTLIVERMIWEQERVGWNKEKAQRVRVVKDETYEGTGDWKRFGCYLLVESFVLKRNNGRILLTYDFRHTHQIRSKWESHK
uniref:Uncharacterized protein n=1 Tax=Chenopodium quinoa TaxID=63459 RepID=A0A803KVB1_CHEQI